MIRNIALTVAAASCAALLAALPAGAQANECGEALLAKGEQLHGSGHLGEVVKIYTQALETCGISGELAAHI